MGQGRNGDRLKQREAFQSISEGVEVGSRLQDFDLLPPEFLVVPPRLLQKESLRDELISSDVIGAVHVFLPEVLKRCQVFLAGSPELLEYLRQSEILA
jgi:hypothetical protein